MPKLEYRALLVKYGYTAGVTLSARSIPSSAYFFSPGGRVADPEG
jgi:hypothetical protein